jgi:hypothetical protein
VTTPLDPELAVALDVLLERYSPPKPYAYEWEVEHGPSGRILFLACAANGEVKAGHALPALHAPREEMDAVVGLVFRLLEAEPWRQLFDAYALWRLVHHAGWRVDLANGGNLRVDYRGPAVAFRFDGGGSHPPVACVGCGLPATHDQFCGDCVADFLFDEY